MNLTTDRIGLVSYSVPNSCNLIIGEIYDKDIRNNFSILTEMSNNLHFLYPFKVKKVNNQIKIYNEDDFLYFRKKYKLTSTITLHNGKLQDNDCIVFKSPHLYNISKWKSISHSREILYKQPTNLSSNCRIFIVLPHKNPIIRGKILNQCIDMTKEHTPLYLLIGDKYGHNKETTSTLMKRYLLLSGVKSDNINKSICDKFPDSLIEAFEILPLMLNLSQFDLFIACSSDDICEVMSFVRDTQVGKKMCKKMQFICDQ